MDSTWLRNDNLGVIKQETRLLEHKQINGRGRGNYQ